MTAPATDVDVVLRPFALGLATGARTTAGVTGVALTGGGIGPVSRALSSTWGRRVVPVLCAGELLGDKLPQTPSRLEGPGFPIRMVASALSGVAIAERDDSDPLATAAFAVAGASLGAVLGSAMRSAAKRRGWSDFPIALAEDLLAAAFTFIGVAAARDHN